MAKIKVIELEIMLICRKNRSLGFKSHQKHQSTCCNSLSTTAHSTMSPIFGLGSLAPTIFNQFSISASHFVGHKILNPQVTLLLSIVQVCGQQYLRKRHTKPFCRVEQNLFSEGATQNGPNFRFLLCSSNNFQAIFNYSVSFCRP